MTPLSIVIIFVVSSHLTLCTPIHTAIQYEKRIPEESLTPIKKEVQVDAICNDCNVLLIRKKRFWWRNSDKEETTEYYAQLPTNENAVETSTEDSGWWGSWFNNIGSSIKKGFKKIGKKIKSGVSKIRRSFSRTKDKFNVFVDKLKERVARGDNKAIELLQKLGIVINYDSNGEITGSEVDSEAHNVEDTLISEGMLVPTTVSRPNYNLTTEGLGIINSTTIDISYNIDSNIATSNQPASYSRSIYSILTSKSTVFLPYRSSKAPTTVADLFTSPMPTTHAAAADMHYNSSIEYYYEVAPNTITHNNTTKYFINSIPTSINTVTSTARTTGNEANSTINSSIFTRTNSSEESTHIILPITGIPITASTTLDSSPPDIPISDSSSEIQPVSDISSEIQPISYTSTSSIKPDLIISTSTSAAHTSYQNISTISPTPMTESSTNWHTLIKTTGITAVKSSTPTDEFQSTTETSPPLPTGPTTPPPFPDIFKETGVRNRLHEIFLNADFNHNDLNNIFEYDPYIYDYEIY